MQSPVPSLSHGLSSLSKILGKAADHCEAGAIDPDALLTARLYPDMMTLIRNVQTACDTAKGAAARLAGVENPVFEDTEDSFAALQARIDKTLAFMAGIPAEAFDDADEREVLLPAGGQEYTFTGERYLAVFVWPNFYFHLTTAYGILRHNGVVLGKRDYLGAG